MPTIPVFTDTISQSELKQAIEQYSEITLTTIDNPEKFRSSLSDPVVLAAIITTGGVVLSALINAFVLLYTNRKNKGEVNGKGSIIININSEKLSESQVVIPLDNFKLDEYKAKLDELELHPEIIENINYSEEP